MADPKHNGAPRAILLIVLLIAGHALGGQAERKPFVVDRFDVNAELEMDYFRYETRARQGARTVIERSVFSQLLRLGIGGYSFDPRLLRYRLHVDLGHEFLSGKFDAPFESDIPRRTSTQGRRLNYDLLVQLFPYSRESLSLWTRRRDYLVKELLFDTFSIEEEVYGARFDTRWPLFPFSVTAETRDLIERGLFEDSRERSDSVRFEMRKEFSERSRLDIDYEYLRRRRVTTGEYRSPQRLVLEERTHRADLYYQYRFGSLLRSNVSSWLSYLNQQGTFPFNNLLGRERLNLFHSPTLQSDYAVTYQKSEIGSHKIKAGEMEVGLRHRLFENFITRLEARFRHTDEGDFTWDELELLGSWNYWRHTPLGRLLVNYLIQNTARTSDNIAYENNILYNFFEIAHEFKIPLRVFYRLEDQRVDVKVPGQIAITNSTEHTIGYEVPWRRWAWLQQYRLLDDTLGRTDIFSSELHGYISLPLRSTLNLRLGYEDLNYHRRLEDSQNLFGLMGYVLPFGRTGLFEIETMYGDRVGITNESEWRVRSGLQWRWRKLRVDFSGQYGLFDNRRSDIVREGTHLLLTVRRDFR